MSSPIADPDQPAQEPTGRAQGEQMGPGSGAEQEEIVAQLEDSLVPEQDNPMHPYDAILLASFGGPEAAEEVVPFLRRVTAGRGIPDERLEEVGEHYFLFGGKSPINDQNRALIEEIRGELTRRGISIPVLFGNRNSEPFLVDTFRQAHDEGMTRVLAITTSAYSSYSSCRQYREDFAQALDELGQEGKTVQLDKIRQYWNHPGFSRTNTRLVTEAARQMIERTGVTPYLLLVTHSLPTAMDETSGPGDEDGSRYSREHLELSAAIASEAGATLGVQGDMPYDLVYCSRSGPPSQPWLELDVNDRLKELAQEGVKHVLLAPIGFISDHMEVIYDLDTEAMETATEVGIDMVRVPTVGVDTEFVMGLVDLALERAAQARGEQVAQPTWPGDDPRPAICRPGCCPNLRVAKPALCGAD